MTAHQFWHRYSLLGAVLFTLAAYALASNAPADNDTAQAVDEDTAAYLHSVRVCHAAYGPSTAPELDEQGDLHCVNRRGERMAYHDRPSIGGKP